MISVRLFQRGRLSQYGNPLLLRNASSRTVEFVHVGVRRDPHRTNMVKKEEEKMGIWKYWAISVLVVWNLLGDAMTPVVYASEKKEKPKINVVRSPSQPVERVEREVRHELLMLPYYSVYDFLSFRVNDTRVELSGYASQPTLKTDAERAVKNIEGVTAVTNNIEALPVSTNDTRIRWAAYRAIYGSEALQTYAIRALPPIHLIVKNGSIILEGVVAREMDKIIANQQANSIPGVFSVTNNLRVEKK